jgi:hypothetical protein
MRSNDLKHFNQFWPKWAKELKGQINSVALLSPAGEEINLAKKLFPNVSVLMEEHWDLYGTIDKKFDLVIASNVFMASKDPDLWFDNVLAVGRYAFIQDNVLGWRTAKSELATGTGDFMRYSYLPDHPARIDTAYDLHKQDHRIKEIVFYNCPPGPENRESKAFVMFMKSDRR